MSFSIEEDTNEFLNKKIIVTGASSGIGLTVAMYFLNCGAQVILAGQDIETMKKICKDYHFSFSFRYIFHAKVIIFFGLPNFRT